MNKNVVCGIDVHQDFFVATILGEDKKVSRFDTDQKGILGFKEWLRENSCGRAAIESTGIYWVPIYVALEDEIDIVVANSHQVKQIPGRKTDESDSEWLAKLLRSDLIKPSYIPEKDIRDLRDLTRFRVKLVQMRTDFKNRVRKILERANIRLASVLSDIFGKTGLEILKGLTTGGVEEVLEKIEEEKREEIEKTIRGNISESDVFLLDECIGMIEMLNERIANIEMKIAERVDMKDNLEIVTSVPGVGKTAAWEILSEIGDISRFPSAKKLASWAGLAPSVYQSGGKNLTGSTRKGSKWLRKTMFQVAQGASRSKKTRLKRFYLHIKAKKGYKVAIVALARKILCIIYHLLTTGEAYVEEGFSKSKPKKPKLKITDSNFEIKKAIHTLQKAGYTISPE